MHRCLWRIGEQKGYNQVAMRPFLQHIVGGERLFMSRLSVRFLTFQGIGCLLLLLAGCSLAVPRTGMGAVFATPQAAFADALGPQGWLEPDLSHLMLHQQQETPEGMLVLYSGYSNGSLLVGSADAKPRRNGWYTHGMSRMPVPGLSGTQTMNCTVVRYPSSGMQVVTVTGQVRQPEVRAIDVVFDTGVVERAALRDGVFMVLTTQATTVQEIRGLDQQGVLIKRIPSDECSSEP